MRATHDQMGFIPQDRGAYHTAAMNLPVPIGMFMPQPPVPAFQQPPIQPNGRSKVCFFGITSNEYPWIYYPYGNICLVQTFVIFCEYQLC